MAGRFISRGRMARAKWEESEAHRRLKNEYDGKKHPITHTNCSCGSMECLAVPTINSRREILSDVEAENTLKNKKKRPAKKISIDQYNKTRGYN